MKMMIFGREGVGEGSGGGDVIGREKLPLKLLQKVSNRSKAKNKAKKKGRRLRIVQRND